MWGLALTRGARLGAVVAGAFRGSCQLCACLAVTALTTPIPSRSFGPHLPRATPGVVLVPHHVPTPTTHDALYDHLPNPSLRSAPSSTRGVRLYVPTLFKTERRARRASDPIWPPLCISSSVHEKLPTLYHARDDDTAPHDARAWPRLSLAAVRLFLASRNA